TFVGFIAKQGYRQGTVSRLKTLTPEPDRAGRPSRRGRSPAYREGDCPSTERVQEAPSSRPIQLWKRPSGSYFARTQSRRAIFSSLANFAGRRPRFSSARPIP